MGKKSKPPPAPDYTKLAEQTAASNAAAIKTQTEANRPDQTDVYGNTSKWSQDPTTGQWSQTQSLSQGNQQLLDQQNALRSQLMGQVGNTVGQPTDLSKLQDFSGYDMSKLQGVDLSQVNGGQMGLLGGAGEMGQLQGGYGDMGQLQGGYGDYGKLQENYGQMGNLQGAGMFNMDSAGNSKAIQDATYGLLAPQREMARNAEVQRLKNQGLSEDSPAFQRAIARLDTGDTQAQLQSLLAGQTEYGNQFARAQGQNQQNFGQNLSAAQLANAQQNQLFGQDLSRQQFANSTRGQQSAEDLAQANFNSQNQQQRYAQDMGQAQFGSQNQQQAWNQNLQQAQYGDQQQQQRFNQAQQQQQMAMALRQQQFGEQGSQAELNAGQRAQQFNEQDYLRNQPMNDLQKIMQMQSYSNPQFGQFATAGTAGGTDYSGAGAQQYGAAMDAVNAKNSGVAGMTSGIVGLAGAAATAY